MRPLSAHTGQVIGAEFTGVLHAAKGGRVGAFTRLWADLNPVLTRYLRVVSVADADDVACESWVTVLRRLPAFEGDETAWRTLVFATARMYADDESQRLVWDAMVEPEEGPAAVAPGPLPAGEEPFEEDELEGGPAHGLRMAIEAIRDLPPEQADVVMLRRAALLPEDAVAELVGEDLAAVHAAEEEALDGLGIDAELVTWALSAEPRPVELADEAAVLAVYRSVFRQPAPTPRQARNGHAAAAVSSSPAASPARTRPVATPAGTTPAGVRVIALRPPTWRTRAGAAAAASAAVLGMGALSAAAYQGVLPGPVQEVMHHVIGAPASSETAATAQESQRPYTAAPGTTTRSTTVQTTSQGTREVTFTTAGGAPAVVNLCKAWETDQDNGVTADRSTAYRELVEAARSQDVGAYCKSAAIAVAASTTKGSTTEPDASTSDTTPPATPTPTTGAPTTTTQSPAPPTATPPASPPVTTTSPSTPTTDSDRTRTPKPTKPGKPRPKPTVPSTTTPPPTDDGRTGPTTGTPTDSPSTSSTTTDPAPAETDTTTTTGQLTPSGRFTPGASPQDPSSGPATVG